MWMTSEIRKEIRIRDHLRKKYIKNKIGTNERKNKNQRNKVNNLKKSAKENFYVSINRSNGNTVSVYTFMCNVHELYHNPVCFPLIFSIF
jgi:hypothetical protein